MRQPSSKDAGPKRGWIWGWSHIDWRKERVPARTLAPKEGGLCCPSLVGEDNKPPFIKVWKPSPSRCVLKPHWLGRRTNQASKGSPKGKAQRGQYVLEVDLGCYKSSQKKHLSKLIWIIKESSDFEKFFCPLGKIGKCHG